MCASQRAVIATCCLSSMAFGYLLARNEVHATILEQRLLDWVLAKSLEEAPGGEFALARSDIIEKLGLPPDEDVPDKQADDSAEDNEDAGEDQDAEEEAEEEEPEEDHEEEEEDEAENDEQEEDPDADLFGDAPGKKKKGTKQSKQKNKGSKRQKKQPVTKTKKARAK